ncbi:MAG TPA: hypothetical protein VFZ32_07270 [Micromonosporaceae bacterium]
MRDVIFLVADGSIGQMLLGFLGRPQFHRSLGCGPFDFEPSDIIPHDRRDPGVYRDGPELLRIYQKTHARAVILLDNAWEGSPGPAKIHDDLTRRLRDTWDQFAVIVLDPELEAWVWQDNPQVATALGCPADFRETLARSGHWPRDKDKPPDPKAALDYLQRKYRDLRRDGYRVDRSPALFRRLASRISVQGCVDPAFLRLRDTLRGWFPGETL